MKSYMIRQKFCFSRCVYIEGVKSVESPYMLCVLACGQLLKLAAKVSRELDLPNTCIEVVDCSLSTLSETVHQKTEQGFEVFISGSAYATELARCSRAPIAEVPVQEIDYLIAARRALSVGKHPALVTYRYSRQADLKMISGLLNADIEQIVFEDEVELFQTIQKSPYDVIIGASVACAYAEKIGRKNILIYAGEETIRQSIIQAHTIAVELRKERENDVLMQAVIAQSPIGIIASDENDRIILMNAAAQKYAGIQQTPPLQKTLGDLVPNLSTKHFLQGNIMRSESFKILNDTRIRTTQNKLYVGTTSFGVLTTLQIDNSPRKKNGNNLDTAPYAKWEDIVATSKEMQLAVTKGKTSSASQLPLLLYGEFGVGKLQFAECVHTGGPRASCPLGIINLAALSENDAGRYLLGCADPLAPHIGLLEAADQGTVILQNLDQANLSVQACLLDVLVRKSIVRVGGYQAIPINVRFITVLNGNNEKPANIRPDLFCLLNTLAIKIPALSHRAEDILELFIKELPKQLQRKVIMDGNSASQEILKTYDWSGNLSELHAVASRFTRLAEEYPRCSNHVVQNLLIEAIGEDKIFQAIYHRFPELSDWKSTPPDELLTAIDTMKRLLRYNNTQICERIGIGRTTLWRMTNRTNSHSCEPIV